MIVSKKILLTFFILTTIVTLIAPFAIKPSYACPPPCIYCRPLISSCANGCVCISQEETKNTIKHLKEEFVAHKEWLIRVFFEQHILPALMLFAEQITGMAVHQVAMVGTMMDAKHQLETQRLFQELTAQAHKDYQPSEGMCTFGTTVRSLAASDRNMDLSAMAFSNRVLQRELLSGDAVAGSGATSDILSRLGQFRALYCNKNDNGKGLEKLCPAGSKDVGRINRDVDYTTTFDTPLTLMIDFTSEGDPDHAKNKHATGKVSPDEEDVFALAANLYAHNVAPAIAPTFLISEDGVVSAQGVNHYMNIRALAAKRSVARNSFASIMGMKSQGEKEAQPYLYALIKEMGIPEDEIKKYLGERPSYYAQMEILTKKIYQNPMFYSELYDKPANVARKNASMQAIELMQRRDMYRSSLRTEAILAVMLETALIEQQEQVTDEINRLNPSGELITLPTP